MSDDPSAQLRIWDFTDTRLDKGKDASWRWLDESRKKTMSPAEHNRLEELIDEANERYDLERFEHGDVLAKIWVSDDREVERVEWVQEAV